MQPEHNSKDSNDGPEQEKDHESTGASEDFAEQSQGSDRDNVDQRLSQLERELSEAKDRYLRTVAESENVRRRSERERADLLKYASEAIVKDLLPVLDAFDTALPQTASSSAEQSSSNGAETLHLTEGFRLIQKQLLDVLKKHGLEVVDAQNAPFDPNVHQAIQMIPLAGAETQTVASVFAKGYAIHGRVVRPAMVSVNVPGN